MSMFELIMIALTIILTLWVAMLESKIRVFEAFMSEIAKKIDEFNEEERKGHGN